MKVSIIGLGQRGQKHVDAVMKSKHVSLLSICDPIKDVTDNLSRKYNTKGFYSIDALLKAEKPDIAIVAVPHLFYKPIIETLAEQGVHILKEKPFAISVDEAEVLDKILKKHAVHMMIGCQRRFDLMYQLLIPLLHQVGHIYHIEGKYLLNIPRLDEGWRASKALSGGGALLDMGYHFLDLLLWYFGMPDGCEIKTTRSHRDDQQYDVEDTVILSFTHHQKFKQGDKNTIGSFTISRASHQSCEELTVKGSLGTLILTKDRLERLNTQGNVEAFLDRDKDIFSDALVKQIEHFSDYLKGKEKRLINDYRDHFEHVDLINQGYQADKKCNLSKDDYVWPIITEKTRAAVLKQLDTSISIYDRSGIIKEFEDKFAAYHQRKYALMTNSGTNAIFGLYEGLGLGPGDEVIVPTYTFFATVSPMMYLGATPVFSDCLLNGNIDPREIEKKITSKTKAVMITHMWGLPCEMDEIVQLCRKYNLKLVEDCSHAHGARYKNQLVGTFGEAAVWSLQGQKIITGGEGGILLTNDVDIYARAQLQGQYNKRCKQEIPASHALAKFSLTGFGLKMRAHPLAAAIANEQFDHLDEWLAIKNHYANYIIQSLAEIDFLMPPEIADKNPAWYALVFQYDEKKAGVPISLFIDRLHQLGLQAIEQPNSTCPIHDLPLFKESSKALPRFYKSDYREREEFPVAQRFFEHAIKLPVWARKEDRKIVETYIRGIKKVAYELHSPLQLRAKL